MSLPNAYLTSAKNTADIFKAMQSAQAPERFTTKFLEGLGFPSSNDRAMINVLKALGFLDDSGVPVSRYHQYLDQTQSDLVLAQAIREAYADLFRVNRSAETMNANDVKQKLKTLSEGAFSDRVLTQMASTFTTLCKIADWSGTETFAPVETAEPDASDIRTEPVGTVINFGGSSDKPGQLGLGLIYQINLQLPISRDQAVYDAFFKALKEHLR